jgi:transposase
MGKQIDAYYITKALQLYIEGLSLREIERLLGVSHVTVSNWIKKLNIKRPESSQYHPTYKVFTHEELTAWLANRDNVKGSGTIITELGDKFMLIKWERFRK